MSNIIFQCTGGLLSLFRVASNDKLRPNEKMFWMAALTLLPELSPLYLFSKEKNQYFLLAGVLAFGLGAASNYYVACQIPWNNVKKFLDDSKSLVVHNDTNDKNVKPPDEKLTRILNERSRDELSKEADTLSSQLQKLQSSTSDVEQNKLFKKTDSDLSSLRWEYIHNNITAKQFSKLLGILESLNTNHTMTKDEEIEWVVEVRRDLSRNVFHKLLPSIHMKDTDVNDMNSDQANYPVYENRPAVENRQNGPLSKKCDELIAKIALRHSELFKLTMQNQDNKIIQEEYETIKRTNIDLNELRAEYFNNNLPEEQFSNSLKN